MSYPRFRFRARGAVGCVAALAALAACSSGGNTNSNSGTVTVAVVSNPLITDQMIPLTKSNFTKQHPGIKVKFATYTEGDLRAAIEKNISTHSNAFNVIMIGPYEAPLFAKNGWLTDLSTTYIANDHGYDAAISLADGHLRFRMLGKTISDPDTVDPGRWYFGAGTWRGGLLRQGSILTVTSYATRTAPVVRGKFVLESLLGVPPPPPLPDVPALKDNTVDGSLTVRKRLAEHRSNAVCASCHDLMDPVGLSMEKFDAIGRRRSDERGIPIDAAGGLPDGSRFDDVGGLEKALLSRPELFVGTFAEKLLTYALGRGVEYYDAPAVRKIVNDAEKKDYRFSSILLGIVNSIPFQMRRAEAPALSDKIAHNRATAR